jgi:hypothetical protein
MAKNTFFLNCKKHCAPIPVGQGGSAASMKLLNVTSLREALN